MLTDLQIVQVCADTYAASAAWDWQADIDEVNVYVRQVDGHSIIAFRGSFDAVDWARDFEAMPTMHPRLGMVHSGFLHGMEAVLEALQDYVRHDAPPIIVTGHSLGAARALVAAALLTIAPISSQLPQQLVVFGCPRPGFKTLSDILRSGKYPIRIYRNCRDPISEVPTLLPFWEKPEPDVELSAPGDPDELSVFRDHHMGLYVEGVKKFLDVA